MDRTLLQRMISYASINKEDIVLEVGAGLGFLTELLSQECKRVVTVEVDSKLVKILKGQLHGLQNVDLIEGDILSVNVPPFNKMVSTPPYSISSPILFWLLERAFDCAVLTFQKEFAERLVGRVGSKDYGRLTVSTYYRAEVELLDHISRDMFYPPPDVDSSVVRLKPRKPPFRVRNEKIFFELVRTLFTQRNKKVRNAIVPFLRNRGIKKKDMMKLADSLLFHDRRVRQLAPEDFGALSDEFA
ncbi:ribosomal RNA small subunit methyltransferase A [Candidatus Bathyarchaeota archaeon]|nr:ribosomal RNA small subunit methyltransferase A [Candidatus Bathyarchaeota archaeon]